jgi:hypothetical protein
MAFLNPLSEDELKGAEARYCKDLTLCQAKVEEFQFSETKFESLFDESITKIKEKEKVLIDGIAKHSLVLVIFSFSEVIQISLVYHFLFLSEEFD